MGDPAATAAEGGAAAGPRGVPRMQHDGGGPCRPTSSGPLATVLFRK